MSALASKPLLQQAEEDKTIARLAVEGQRARADGNALMEALLRTKGALMAEVQRIDTAIQDLRREQERRAVIDSLLDIEAPRLVGMGVVA